MIDFADLFNHQPYDLQYFEGNNNQISAATNNSFFSWNKPRGTKFVSIFGAGGGASGANGATTIGNAGGASGAYKSMAIPGMLCPDVLFIQCGAGGIQTSTTAAAASVLGTPTVISVKPYEGDWSTRQHLNIMVLPSGSAPSTTCANPLVFNTSYLDSFVTGFRSGSTALQTFVPCGVLAGQAGGATAGAAGLVYSISATGVTSTPSLFPNPLQTAATGAVTSTPAGNGVDGVKRGGGGSLFLYALGGGGGGGATTTSGGSAGNGGNGAPGCGGGGGGFKGTVNTARGVGGNGGPGFVYIMSF